MISKIRRGLLIACLLGVSPALAEPVTWERVQQLPSQERAAWVEYLERSQASAKADAGALRAEMTANRMSVALRAPDGGDFKLSARAGDPWYASAEAGQLADTILSYQTPTGGWSKHTGYSQGPRKPGMQWTSQNEPGKSPHYVATFDNRSTTEQLHFLANVWQATQREDCRAGFVRGLNFILAAQYPNGGWPQVYPLEGGYHDDITLNDDALAHILELLQSIGEEKPQFAFLDASEREQAAQALESGLRCVLATQVVQHGRPTVWCSQYDAISLKPSSARAFEPATLSGMESAQLLKFLMTIPDPPAELVQSIDSGLRWLDEAKITGPLGTRKDGKPIGKMRPGDVYWARFYDLETGKPVYPGRDGVLYDSLAVLAEHNSLGYDYVSTRPGSILKNGQNKWRKMLAKQARD
jgi:PelA/Pel-15E family pectate lyase